MGAKGLALSLVSVLALILAFQGAGPVERASACSITAPADITASNDPNQAGAVVVYPAPTISGADCGTIVCSPASGSFYPLGTTEVTCSSAGDPGSRDAFLITVNDTQPPVITAPPDQTVPNNPRRATALVTFPPPTVSDNAPGVTLSCDRPFESVYPLGKTPVTCTAEDASRNTATAIFLVTVKDVEPPTIYVPLGLTAVAGPGATSATVAYNAAAHDNSGAAVTPTCAPPSGSAFPLGTSSVRCTAKDAASNLAQASFPIAVISPALKPLRIHLALVQRGRIVYVLSADARATIDLRRCQTNACSKTRSVALMTQNAREGRNAVKIPKRAHGRPIADGPYIAVVSARNDTGGAAPVTVRFRLR